MYRHSWEVDTGCAETSSAAALLVILILDHLSIQYVRTDAITSLAGRTTGIDYTYLGLCMIS